MDRLIKCSDNYNPYIILEVIHNTIMNYAFDFKVVESYSNVFKHTYVSDKLSFEFENNAVHDKYFHVMFSHYDNKRHYNENEVLYKRINLDLITDEKVNILIDNILNTIHKYKDDLKVESRRAVMIASIVE